jgi:dihydroceramidase
VFIIRFLANPSSKNTVKVPFALTVYSAVVTWSYLIINNPIFHQLSYAILVIGVVFRAIKLFNAVPKSYTYEVSRMQCLLWMSALGFIVAFILWNIDNQFCSNLRSWRSTVPFLIGSISEVKKTSQTCLFISF